MDLIDWIAVLFLFESHVGGGSRLKGKGLLFDEWLSLETARVHAGKIKIENF